MGLLDISHLVIFSHLIIVLVCFICPSFGYKPKHFNLSTHATHWGTAGATWYGSPHGAGSDGNFLSLFYVFSRIRCFFPFLSNGEI